MSLADAEGSTGKLPGTKPCTYIVGTLRARGGLK